MVPVVLHHGEGGWTATRRVEDLFDAHLVAHAGLGDFIPRLSFVLDDLAGVSDHDLQARHLALEPLLVLWALRDARSRSRLEGAVEQWVPLLAQLFELPEGQQALWTLFRYIFAVADEVAAESLSDALEARKPHVKEAIMTLAEKWFSQGKAEGKAETLRKQLTFKFGELSPTAAQRLAAASDAELDRLLERVLSAATLDQVFG